MRFLLLIAHLLCLMVLPALASNDPVRLALIAGKYDVVSKQAYFGLKVSMDSGWHSYWKSPGDGGLPPEFKVSMASNVTGLKILWPAPGIVRTSEGDSVGYAQDVVFPLAFSVVDPAKPVNISLSVTFYACSTICQPFRQEIASRVDPASQASTAALVEAWLNKIPRQDPDQKTVLGSYDPKSGQMSFEAGAFPASKYAMAFLDTGLDFAATPLYVDPGRRMIMKIKALDRRTLDQLSPPSLVIADDDGAKEYRVVFASNVGISRSILLIAFIGGLILNLMPCVLPVLSLKLLSFTKEAQGVRQGFLWSAAGIWVSFICLGIGLLAVKGLGMTMGWGLQFQNPFFLAIMALITALFAVSMVDGVTIALPSSAMTKLSRTGIGSGRLSSFLQGFVATLLATPCSAPFVGTAVGFAFAADSALVLVMIFAAMGIGMALPYLLIAAIPGVHKLVPKPGRWMARLKTILAALMAGMSGYLVYLTGETASTITGLVLLVLLAIAALVLTPGKFGKTVLIAAMLAVPLYGALTRSATDAGSPWVAFKPELIDGLVSSGKTVVVDISAKWCITCRVNDDTVLNQASVITALKQPNVVAMRGNWTRPDAGIAAYLKGFNRFGLPFTIVYTPHYPIGQPLPELLKASDILSNVKVDAPAK